MKLTLEQIRALVDDRYIERGRAYLASGQLQLTKVTANQVTAKCAGTRLYDVTLRLRVGKLSGRCTCPALDEFGPCKHMAATALAVMTQDHSPSPSFLARQEQISHLERTLQRMSKAALVALVMQLVPEEELEQILTGDEE